MSLDFTSEYEVPYLYVVKYGVVIIYRYIPVRYSRRLALYRRCSKRFGNPPGPQRTIDHNKITGDALLDASCDHNHTREIIKSIESIFTT